MKKRVLTWFIAIAIYTSSVSPVAVRADFFGGDLPMLAQIVANTLQQLSQLRQILGAGRDTIGLLRDINEGIREAMGLMKTMNTTIKPGVLSQIQHPNQAMKLIEQLYGPIAKTFNAPLERLTDQSVAEAVTLHNQAFQYADMVDPEAERIKDYSRGVSPAGAGRLTAQSLGVLINVTNQVLRTNAAMLKIMSEQLALQNRREKANSTQFQMQYEGLSSALKTMPTLKDSTTLGETQ